MKLFGTKTRYDNILLEQLRIHKSQRGILSLEMQGFDKLQRQLTEASKAFKELDGEIMTLHFHPGDQSSVECAIARLAGV